MNWKMIFGLFMVLLIAIGISIIAYYEVREDLNIRYKMPNGILCKSSRITGGGFGGATQEFFGCSDGKRYINPETYTKYKVKNKLSIKDVLLGVNE